MRVLIAGCGRLGTAAGRLLLARGHELHGLRRNAGLIPAPIRPIAADLADPLLADKLPADIDAVIYSLTPSSRDEAGYQAAYVDGLHALMSLPALASPQIHWLFVSSTAVYGDAQGGWVDETTPTRPERFNGRVLVQAESALTSARPLRCVLRLGGIYGPGRQHWLSQLQRGQLTVAREQVHWTNRIHSTDAARLIAQLTDARITGVINGVDTGCASETEVADWLSARLGLAPAAGLPAEATIRPSKRIRSARLGQLPFYHRYPDYRAGYSALLAADQEDSP